MNVLVIQNSKSAPAGYLGEHLIARCNAQLTIVEPHEIGDDERLATSSDLVVALGSPRGAYDSDAWIGSERRFLRAAMRADVPVLGICFGAQLIASALGGRAVPSGRRYCGWYENDVVTESWWRGPWLRWHGDEIHVPAEAEVLATSQATVQAFRYRRSLGVQFHPEAGAQTLDDWIALASDDLRAQLDVAALRSESAERFAAMAGKRAKLFDGILASIV